MTDKTEEQILHPYQGKSDDALYGAFLSGNNEAYDALMLRYGDSLTIYLNRYLQSLQDAEDMMIEAFARIMVRKPMIRGSFKAYLYQTARNSAVRLYRKKRRTEVFSLDGLERELADVRRTEDDLRDRERDHALHRCMARLEPQLREVIWLKYFENMSYEDAAKVTGVSKKRVDNLLQRGKEQLKAELKKEGITHVFD